jgi:hypothetical protein
VFYNDNSTNVRLSLTGGQKRVSVPSQPNLQQVITALRQRWGADVLQSLSQLSPSAHLPTGFPALDQALSGGGLPGGAITHLCGQPTSGMVTLALKAMAQAQTAGYAAVAIDLTRTLDLDYARRCGVHLDRLALVWPRPPLIGLDMVRDITLQGLAVLFLFDATPAEVSPDDLDRLYRSLRRVKAALVDTPAVLLCLTQAADHPCAVAVSSVAALQLDVVRVRWLHHTRDVVGYDIQITVRKDRHHPPGRSVTVTVHLDETPGP